MINNNTPTEIDTINKSLKSRLLSLFFISSPSYMAELPYFFQESIVSNSTVHVAGYATSIEAT